MSDLKECLQHQKSSRLVEGKITKGDFNKLLHNYAIAHIANAPTKVAQKHYDKYQAILKKYEKEYGAEKGWSSDFTDTLARHATKYWNSRGMKGPSVDW